MRIPRDRLSYVFAGIACLASVVACSASPTAPDAGSVGGKIGSGKTGGGSSVGGSSTGTKSAGGSTSSSANASAEKGGSNAGGSQNESAGGSATKGGSSSNRETSGGASSSRSSSAVVTRGGSANISSGGAAGRGGGVGGRVGVAGRVGSDSTGGIGVSNVGGAAGASTTANSADSPTAVTGLKIEANPKNALSAFVSWTTDKPAESTVQFGQGKYEWEITDSAKVTTHKVLIIGMYASKTYQIKAISGSVSATDKFTTGALPSTIPIGKVTSADPTKVQPGWTLMNILKASSTMGPISNDPSMAVMYDSTGQPVWYHINGKTGDFGGATSTYLTDKGVLIGPVMSTNGTGESPREVDFAGNTIWECKDPLCGGTGDLTHDTIKLSNGNYVVLRWKEIGDGTNLDSNTIFEEIDRTTGKVVWSLDFGKLVPKPSGVTGDWCHGNSILVDIEKDAVYANCRFMGLIKTTYKNPNSLVWYLPASYGKATGNMAFSPTTSQYSDTHDPEVHDDGTILIFDNGGYNSSMMPGMPSTTTYHTRVVEYKIDEAKKTASLVWEFPGSFNVDSWYKDKWYNAYWGDADRLANGNVLITGASVSANNGDARVFEVQKSDGKVVWEFKLDATFGAYRADRITPPLIKAITQ